MSGTEQQCDLCGLPVPPKAYPVRTAERVLTFCCEGCKGIWLMLNGEPEAPSDKGAKPT